MPFHRLVFLSTIMFHLKAFLLALIAVCTVWGQDLQYGCITCQDKYEKCEIDCVLQYHADGVTRITSCQNDCVTAKSSCVDTSTALACQTCSLNCAVSYDTALRSCLKSIPREVNQDTEYSSCESGASATMDTCMAKCKATYAK